MEVKELLIHGGPQYHVRNNHGEDHQVEQHFTSFEFELGKSVGNDTTGQGLQGCTKGTQQEGVSQSLEKDALAHDILVLIQRPVLWNQLHRCIGKILLCHKRACNFGVEGENNHISHAKQKNKAENFEQGRSYESSVQVLHAKSRPTGGSFKFHTDLVFALFQYLWFFDVRMIHFSFLPSLSLFAGRTQTPIQFRQPR